jgi:hypothetical protein
VLDGGGADPRAALDELADIGFERAGVGDDPRGEVALTEVRYAKGAIEAGKLVLSYVAPDARLVQDPDLEGADVVLVLGADFESILVPASLTTSTTSAFSAEPVALVTEAPLTGSDDESLTPAPIANESELGEPAPKTPPC